MALNAQQPDRHWREQGVKTVLARNEQTGPAEERGTIRSADRLDQLLAGFEAVAGELDA